MEQSYLKSRLMARPAGPRPMPVHFLYITLSPLAYARYVQVNLIYSILFGTALRLIQL